MCMALKEVLDFDFGTVADVQQLPLCNHRSLMPANSVLARPLFSGAFGQDLSQSEVTVTSAVTNAERSIAVLPAPGHFASLRLTNETGDGESEMLGGGVSETISCSLRLEACANCVIGMELEPVANRFSESQAVKLSKCDDLSALHSQPCFNFVVIEERADRPFVLQPLPLDLDTHSSAPSSNAVFYRRASPWNSSTLTRQRFFNSTSRSLLVVVVLRNVVGDVQLLNYVQELFPIKISVFDNTEVITGHAEKSIFSANQLAIGYLESPRFPEAYPRLLQKNYTLLNENPNGFVRLIFDDFHVHYLSELRIIDSDGQEFFNTRREHRRPPALSSSGRRLTLIFSARAFTQSIGFRARYEFVDSKNWPDRPSPKNCDEYLESYGGQISLDNQKHLINSYVDCLWLVGRFPSIASQTPGQQIYLRVEEFQLRGASLRLEVRRGSNSGAERVALFFDEQSADGLAAKQPKDGFVTAGPSNGDDDHQPAAAFYIRLRGFLTYNQGLSIVYAHFYRWATALCPGVNEFHCDNSKCIKNMLRCDGYNHCGDSSEEICHVPDIVLDGEPFNVPSLLTVIVGVVSTLLILIMVVALASAASRNQFIHRLGDFPFQLQQRLRTMRTTNANDPAAGGGSLGNENGIPSAPPHLSNSHYHHNHQCQRNNANLYCRNGVIPPPLRGRGNVELALTRSSDLLSAHHHRGFADTTGGVMVPSIQTVGDRRFYVLPPENRINVIEAPPTYDDALKHPAVPLDRLGISGYNNMAFRTSLPEMVIASVNASSNQQSSSSSHPQPTTTLRQDVNVPQNSNESSLASAGNVQPTSTRTRRSSQTLRVIFAPSHIPGSSNLNAQITTNGDDDQTSEYTTARDIEDGCPENSTNVHAPNQKEVVRQPALVNQDNVESINTRCAAHSSASPYVSLPNSPRRESVLNTADRNDDCSMNTDLPISTRPISR